MAEHEMGKLSVAENQPPFRVTSLPGLEARLRELHAACEPEQPICAQVDIPGYEICVGLGADPTFVMIHVEPYDGEFYISRGDTEAVGCVGFSGCGHWTPMDKRNFVPFADALHAVLEFVGTRQLSSSISWENWNQIEVSHLTD